MTRQDVMKWRRGRAARVGRRLAARRQAAALNTDGELKRILLRGESRTQWPWRDPFGVFRQVGAAHHLAKGC